MKKTKKILLWSAATLYVSLSLSLTGCTNEVQNHKTVIEIVSYKQEAVEYFEELENKFNETHDDIELIISSPNDAMTVLKTRFVREDNPDIIAMGGDYNYSLFVDADMLMDISDFSGMSNINTSYTEMIENLEFVPTEGVFAIPYMANAAGILYNKDIFEENGWEIPQTWEELIELSDNIEDAGQLPFSMGYRDTWTTLSPWASITATLTDPDICRQVNRGETDFSSAYFDAAEKIKVLTQYGPETPTAYSYNDACTSFARGESAMYMIGSYAVPQIKSINPDMNIGMFTLPASSNESENILTSGVDLMFAVMEDCPDKEAAYTVLEFLYKDENIQNYIDNQNAIPCKNGDFKLTQLFDSVSGYISEGRVADFQDHFYPAEMSVDALIQTFLLEEDTISFLENFDTLWLRYNRDLIEKVNEYEQNREEN